MMHQQISKKILIYLFLFIIFSTLNNKSSNKLEFLKIDEINISGIDINHKIELMRKLNFFKYQNIFLLNETKIIEIINSNPYIEKFSIFKKYPSVLEVQIHTTEFIAYVKKKEGLFFLGSNRKLILANNEVENIPYIFGNFDNDEFFILKKMIDNSNFDYDEIKNLYFFPSNRWDIETRSGVLIKLPNDKLNKSLELSLKILSDDSFNNVKLIDLRQNNQIIINE